MVIIEKTKILIATTNQGKYQELSSHLSDLPFTFVNLNDVGLGNIELDEPFDTTQENAIHKATFFAKKSNLITIAEDTGFFVPFLNNIPGVKAKRFGANAIERNTKILSLLNNILDENRTAYFETHACVYNPFTSSFTVFNGKVNGLIAHEAFHSPKENMGYDAIFFFPPLQKLFCELSTAEKNMVSHRGKIARQLKLFLHAQFGFKQIIAPLGIIIKDRRMFVNKRRDTYAEFNNKWEFPGGGIENGEEVIDCLHRELKEETGFEVSVLEQIPKIYTATKNSESDPYQIFLLFYFCAIKGGHLSQPAEESSGGGWVTYNEALALDFLPLNKQCLEENEIIFKKFID